MLDLNNCIVRASSANVLERLFCIVTFGQINSWSFGLLIEIRVCKLSVLDVVPYLLFQL